jgi:transposase
MKIVLTNGIKGLDKKVDAIMNNEGLSKSGKMKELFRLGLEIKEIATMLGVRYNFVYNVVSNMVIVEGIEVEQNKQSSKKDAVWALLDEGKTAKEIAVELKTNYNYVYKLRKEWQAKVEAEVKAQNEAYEKEMMGEVK